MKVNSNTSLIYSLAGHIINAINMSDPIVLIDLLFSSGSFNKSLYSALKKTKAKFSQTITFSEIQPAESVPILNLNNLLQEFSFSNKSNELSIDELILNNREGGSRDDSLLDNFPSIIIFHCEFSKERGPKMLVNYNSLPKNKTHSYKN